MKFIRNFCSRIFSNLTRSAENEPLSKFVLLLILMLDIFVLDSILRGLVSNSKIIKTEDRHFPSFCHSEMISSYPSSYYFTNIRAIERTILYNIDMLNRNISINKNPSEIANNPNSWQLDKEGRKNDDIHPICQKFGILILDFLIKNQDIVWQIRDREMLKDKYARTKTELEKLSVPNINPDSRKSGISDSINSNYDELNSFHLQIQEIDRQLGINQNLLKFQNELAHFFASNSKQLRADLIRFMFWYPIKVFFIKALFLLPLFLAFYFWFNRSIKKGRPIQKVISANMLFVAIIPLFLEAISLIYNILPKTLLKKILNILSSLKLDSLFYYFVIGLAVLFSVWLINFLQKKYFNYHKVVRKRVAKNSCIHCAEKFSTNILTKYCIKCGKNQFVKCHNCGSETYDLLEICLNCGLNPKIPNLANENLKNH